MGGANTRAGLVGGVKGRGLYSATIRILLEYSLIRNGRGGCFGNGLQVIPSFTCQTTLLFFPIGHKWTGIPWNVNLGFLRKEILCNNKDIPSILIIQCVCVY